MINLRAYDLQRHIFEECITPDTRVINVCYEYKDGTTDETTIKFFKPLTLEDDKCSVLCYLFTKLDYAGSKGLPNAQVLHIYTGTKSLTVHVDDWCS